RDGDRPVVARRHVHPVGAHEAAERQRAEVVSGKEPRRARRMGRQQEGANAQHKQRTDRAHPTDPYRRPGPGDKTGRNQKPSTLARWWSIPSSAPPPMEMSRVSTNARPATLSFM